MVVDSMVGLVHRAAGPKCCLYAEHFLLCSDRERKQWLHEEGSQTLRPGSHLQAINSSHCPVFPMRAEVLLENRLPGRLQQHKLLVFSKGSKSIMSLVDNFKITFKFFRNHRGKSSYP